MSNGNETGRKRFATKSPETNSQIQVGKKLIRYSSIRFFFGYLRPVPTKTYLFGGTAIHGNSSSLFEIKEWLHQPIPTSEIQTPTWMWWFKNLKRLSPNPEAFSSEFITPENHVFLNIWTIFPIIPKPESFSSILGEILPVSNHHHLVGNF